MKEATRVRVSRGHDRRGGFTLVEILIVISIIAVLASMIVVAVQYAMGKADDALASNTIADLTASLERYAQDEGTYPGVGLEADPERNDFPLLFDALFDQPAPKGKGGRSAPYTNPKEDQIALKDPDTGEYRPVARSERFDPDIEKFILDPWGEPYIYRCNKGQNLSENLYMHNQTADIYSKGPDGIDQTMLGEDADNDDIGNW